MAVDRDHPPALGVLPPQPVARPLPNPRSPAPGPVYVSDAPHSVRPAGAAADVDAATADPAPPRKPPSPAVSGTAAEPQAAVRKATPPAADPRTHRSAGGPPACCRAARRRELALAGVASAAAIALAALLGLALSEEPAPLAGPPALADGLAAPPLAAERAAGGAEMLTAGPLLAAFRLPTPRLTGGEMRPSATAASPAPVSPVAGAEPSGATDAGPGLASGSKLASTAGMALRAGDHGNPLYELAHRLQRKGETASAIRVYGLAAETDPRHAATFYDWGYLLQQQGHEDAARAKYRQALQIAPQHAFAHYNLAYLLQRAGDDLAAIEHYRAAIAANPRFAWSHYNLGWLEQKLGHHRAALAEYRRSVELDPQQALARQNIATILRRDRR